MFGFLKNLFGPGVDYNQIYTKGATIIDVRTTGEFAGGHIKGSLNIPLDSVNSNIEKIKNMKQPIITCCASGMRSGSAKNMLKSKGIRSLQWRWLGIIKSKNKIMKSIIAIRK